MAIEQPGAINRTRGAAEGPQRSGGRQAKHFFVSREECRWPGSPRPRGGPAGEKSGGRRCGQTIEAEPALGQIRPSEVRVLPAA